MYILHLALKITLYFVLLTGDYRDQLFVVQGGLPQQSQLFHDAADRGTVPDGSPR